MWHLLHCFSDSGDFEHCAHAGVGCGAEAVVDEDDEASVDVALSGLVVELFSSERSAMAGSQSRVFGILLEDFVQMVSRSLLS